MDSRCRLRARVDRALRPVDGARRIRNRAFQLARRVRDGLHDGRTPVLGSTTCSVTSRSSETRGDREIVHGHFSCLDEMSDPRVSGSDEIDVATVFAVRGDNRAAPWTAELMVSNEGGTWRGACTGALEFTTGPLGLPTNYGICTLAGEGGYMDLSYAYLLAGGNEELRYAGWIESAR